MADVEDEPVEEQARRQVLVAANLFDEDPDLIEGLIFPIPNERTLAALLRDYDTQRTTNRKVRCAVCPTHTKHFRGFVGQLDDGSLSLIGINCGEDRFGKGAWAEMSATLKRQQDEAYYQGRIDPACRQIKVVYPLLQQWRTKLKTWRDFKDNLKLRHSELFKELRQAAATREGHLVREHMVVVQTVDENGRAKQEKKPQVQPYGRIPYPAGFVSSTGDRRLSEAGECLEKANRILSDKRDLRSLEQAFRILRDGRKLLDDVEEFHQGWVRNGSLAWWNDACNWHNAQGGSGRMRLQGRVITCSNDGDPIRVELPDVSLSGSMFGTVAAEWPR